MGGEKRDFRLKGSKKNLISGWELRGVKADGGKKDTKRRSYPSSPWPFSFGERAGKG